MNGIALSRAFYEEYGAPMLQREFPAYAERIAVGVAGEGSECLGYDDALSMDHDFDGGFILWLTNEDAAQIGAALGEAYAQLPLAEFTFRHTGMEKQTSAYGGGRRGVKTIDGFFTELLGDPHGPADWQDWLLTPSYALCNATNGEIFCDALGELTKRRAYLSVLPEDIRRKKIAACAAYMAQSGQYNYMRCMKRGEAGAAYFALTDFAKHTAAMAYLLNRRHCPYYKWMLRGMRELPILGGQEAKLSSLLTEALPSDEKQRMIEEICIAVIVQMELQGLTRPVSELGSYMETHAFAVMQTIQDEAIRSLHVMQG